MEPDETVKVYDASDYSEAHIIRQMLADAGIEARVASFAVEMAYRVPYQIANCPIWVFASQAERARKLIVDFEDRIQNLEQSTDVCENLFCYHCGSTLTEQVKTCPVCCQALDWKD